MRTVKLHTPKTWGDETRTEFNVEDIYHVQSHTGDDEQEGTTIYVRGLPSQICSEPAKKVREMIEEAKRTEEIQLDVLAIGLLLNAAHKSVDGRIRFCQTSGCLVVMAGGFQTGLLQGRERSRYEQAKRQIVSFEMVDSDPGSKSEELYLLNERGYAMAEFLKAAQHAEDQPFRGCVKLPAAIPSTSSQARTVIGLQFNQTNNNAGNVNNAVSESGDVKQSVKETTGG